MKKQDNHKKPRKLMDQVRDVMRLNRNSSEPHSPYLIEAYMGLIGGL